MKIVFFDDVLLNKNNMFPLRLQPLEFLDHLLMDELAVFVLLLPRTCEARKQPNLILMHLPAWSS